MKNIKAFMINKWTVMSAASIAVVGLGVATFLVGRKHLAKRRAAKAPEAIELTDEFIGE